MQRCIANYKISDEWPVGSKWAYNSGRPYTPIIGTNGNYPDGRPIPVYEPINSGTLPGYHRVDRHYIFNTWKLNTYFELNSVYRRQNIIGYDYGHLITVIKKIRSKAWSYPFHLVCKGNSRASTKQRELKLDG